MKNLIVRFTLDNLAVMDDRQILGLGVIDITDGREGNRFIIGIGLCAVGFRGNVDAFIAFPDTHKPGQWSKIHIRNASI